MKAKYIITAWLTGLLFACTTPGTNPDVNIRARIVNARTNEVLVSKNILFINADTLSIKNENKIKGKIHADKEGLYFIYIYPEFQSIYLKPGDSLSFHINIDEFDESLSFSGNLGFENNLLMELYLNNEKESEYFYQADFQFNPDDFVKKIDSFALTGKKLLDRYPSEWQNTSEKFKQIIDLWQKSLQYDLKETYLLKHPQADLPEQFKAYRQVLKSELADPNIIYMYAFVENYISAQQRNNYTNPEKWYRQTAEIIRRDIADSAFRDNVLVKYCYRYIKDHKPVQNNSLTAYYFELIQNPSFIDYCQQMIDKNRQLQTGNKFPGIRLIDTQGRIQHSDSIFAGKKVLLSFWDLKRRKNFVSNLEKLKNIHQKFPELEIVILNTDNDSFDEWLMQLPKDTGFKFFQSLRPGISQQISPYHPAQIFLLNDKRIQASMINMYRVDFENKLVDFLHR